MDLAAGADFQDQLQAALGAQYTLRRELGRGGMATVFLAEDTKHHRPVALKVLHRELAATLGPERFRREIELAARLQHAHIVSVYDSGEAADGLLWFTMPYVEGESLRDRLNREHQLPVDDAVRIAYEAAQALDYAHRRGVIHRDIKPENILIADGQALVADFGIARALTAAASSATGAALTETGVTLGTPAYMSPEQASGQRDLDARTNVYSLGSVLYEMLAGEPPFTGGSAQAIVARRFTERPRPLRSVRETVPEAVERAVDVALAKSPADRYQSASDFAKALQAAQRTTSAPVAAAPTPSRQNAAPQPPPEKPRRRIPVGLALLGLGFLIGVGVLFAWRSHSGAGSDSSGPVRLAVLPFDNVGDSANAYFADGLTDAVRDKLAAVPGLQVIASASSGQYRHTAKTPREIGQELGVRYLLVGKVRWAKGTGAQSRVEVRPQLVEVASSADKWGAPFDAPLTDVFQVQADIAEKVVHALQVTLSPAAAQTVARRPTDNLNAYDAYLRGKKIAEEGLVPQVQRRAVAAFREAVAQDSTFALAWAALAQAYAAVYSNGIPAPAVGDSAREAAERALKLAPGAPEAHAAMGAYLALVTTDYGHAYSEDSAALVRAPNDVQLLSNAARTQEQLGRWNDAVSQFQQAVRLDPRAAPANYRLGIAQLRLRHYPAARASLDKALALQPDNLDYLEDRATVELAEGNLAGARAVLHAAPATADPAALVEECAQYWDLGWILDSAQEQLLLRMGPAAFDNDRATWAIVLAEQYAWRGNVARSRAYADTAHAAFEIQLKAAPQDAQRHVENGLALAYLGHKTDAVREGEQGVALQPISKDAYAGPYFQHQLVRIYMLVGEPEKALDQLEPLLKVPYYLSPGWLRIDPTFAPLRGNPRFERLLAQPPSSA